MQGQNILLGVCGGIAAYKAIELCSRLVKQGANVHVIMTEAATKFVTPLTFQTISRNAVYVDIFEEKEVNCVSHISLADRTDIVIIAPATANCITKMAVGIADDMLSTTLLAVKSKIFVAPAMNGNMYLHPAVQENLSILRQRNVHIIEPDAGMLACGYEGTGRLASIDKILDCITTSINPFLAGKNILITAGATIERIDPVRFLTNDSSGKMGIALAKAAKQLGAKVHLVYGRLQIPLPEGLASYTSVYSAQDMYEAVLENFESADIVIKTAAVSDYTPIQVFEQKQKKVNNDQLTLQLHRTKDILKTLVEQKNRQFIVGFAAETNNLEEYALKKIQDKKCDLLVANLVGVEGTGFCSDENCVSIYDEGGKITQLPQMSKEQIAIILLKEIYQRIKRNEGEI